MKVVIVSPHYDDAEFGCGGIIAKAAKQGHELVILNVRQNLTEIGEERTNILAQESEAKESARILGCQVDFVDCNPAVDSLGTVRALVDYFRRARPDILIVNYRKDLHPHHKNLSRDCLTACYDAQLPSVGLPEAAYKVKQLLFYETFSTVDFKLDFYVDVSDQFSTAFKSLEAHKTGLRMLPILSNRMKALHMYRGSQSGVMYAEGLSYSHGGWFDTVQSSRYLLDFLVALTPSITNAEG
jgi:LmbE family N-acetylglucosaminyl deacetylase